jgi:hypothetical protein
MKNSIKFYSIIENLVPEYVKEEFPLVVEFLSQYYKSQENQSAALDIIHNIDKYVQIDNVTNLNLKTTLTRSLEFESEIFVESGEGLPKNYGLIKIDNEIIWYDRLVNDIPETIECTIELGSTSFVSQNISNQLLSTTTGDLDNPWIGKVIYIKDENGNIISSAKITTIDSGLSVSTDSPLIPNIDISVYNSDNIYTCVINGTKLTNCTRGFNATIAYESDNTTDELVYEETSFDIHTLNSEITNLSIIFLTEFLKKIKVQLTPGFEDEEFYEKINESTFISNIKQFYASKGTNCSFELLFRALFGEDVNIILPRDFVIQASDAQYNIFRDIVVEELEGNPKDLENLTLYQDEYLNIPEAKGTVANVEKIQRGDLFYYKISLDQTKENTSGSNTGEFSIHPKSKTTIDILSGSDFIDVDSTIGFPESGELEITKKTAIFGNEIENIFGTRVSSGSFREIVEKIIVQYSSKTSTQFLDCTGIDVDIPINSSVRLNTFAYGDNGSERIKVSIGGVISSVNIESSPYYSTPNEQIKIQTIGKNLKDIRSENWFYNITTRYDIEKISFKSYEEKTDSFGNVVRIYTYEIVLYDESILKKGDSVSLLYSQGIIKNGTITTQTNLKSFLVVGFQEIDETLKYQLRKNISKVNSKNYPQLSKYSSNVQNVYIDSDKKIFVNSQSLPNYLGEPLLIADRSVTFSGSYFGSEIINIISHGFYTGDAVVYEPISSDNTLNIKKGIYFVYVVDQNNIKIARSRENINTNNFVKVTGNVYDNKFLLEQFTTPDLSIKKLLPQNIFREVSDPKVPSRYVDTSTLPGTTGLFVNGVEILNYKSKDNLFYGEIENIFPTSSGNGYDIINPPLLEIEDESGFGANGYVSIKGSLDRVEIIDGGFDYLETPTATISGGNGTGANISINLVSVDHSVPFNAKSGINTTNDIVGFSTYHKFRNNEVVYYDPKNQTKVVGLSTNSQYYVSVIDPLNIKLYNTFEDSVSGINTINLTGIGTGRQYFNSIAKKKQIGSIQVINSGSGYETKKRTTSSVGINTFSEIINIKDHDYKDGEIVVYNSSITDIGGLNSGLSYYVTVVNKDQFKLSEVGLGNTERNSFYKIKDYINLTSSGVGTHFFNYEPISITISGRTGIGITYSNQVQLRPIFTGQVTSVHLENVGSSYGSEIINLKKQPNIRLLNGKNAQAKPIIKNGKIISIIVTNIGSEYYSTPKIELVGNGSGAVLTPIIENNTLKEIKVISGGGGYDEGTLINIFPSGSESNFESKIKSWRFNLLERLIRNNQIPPDDGILYEGKNDKNGSEYTHLYAPKKLRESVVGQRISEGIVIYNPDLELINESESNSLTHSPIIGWAYDGNPIYGPYGYAINSLGESGAVQQMKSGYELRTNLQNRPNYPLGSFVEDYYFTENGNLDEHNGRFCITPEFPNGVYAYFCTISGGLPENSGLFKGYKKPEFPYVIGNSYRSTPIDFNFLSTSNLNQFNLNESSLLRNTKPYGLLNKNTYYDQLINPNKIKSEISRIKSVSGGGVDYIGIITGGNNYNIGDKIALSNQNVNAAVSQILGKNVNKISVATTTIFDVEFVNFTGGYVGFSSVPHNLLTNDLVTITSSYDNNISGRIKVDTHSLRLRSGIDSSSITGIVTYLSVSGSLNSSKIRENDIYNLGNEKIKVLNIDLQKSEIRILRNQFNTIGLSSLPVGTALTEDSRKFEINFGITTSYNLNYNSQLYFDPIISVGLGTSGGVGITSTLFLDVVDFTHPVSIGTGSTTFLYFRDIKDIQEYTDGGYINIVNASNASFNTSKKEIISIGTTAIKINFDTSSLSGIGVTAYLNKWNIKVIPTQSIYLPNHKFNTGDLLSYSSNGGTKVSVSTDGSSSFLLSDSDAIYAAKLSNDLIGISTIRVGLGLTGTFVGIGSTSSSLLYFVSIGVGNTHSFTTNYDNILVADVSKNVVTVQTSDPHGLNRNDNIDISVSSGISTTVKVLYNKKHRRVLLDPKDFGSSDVNIIKNTISINNHKLKTGQKVIHTCPGSPVGGLLGDQIYYAIVISENKLRLSNTYYDSIKSNPNYINLTSTSIGTISKINPEINILENSQIIFDVSDSSLTFAENGENRSGFRLDFYVDSLFNAKYENSKKTKVFDVKRPGIVGIDSDAKVILDTKNIPEILYYKLNPINIKINSKENLEIIVDSDVLNNNKIVVDESLYNGNYSVVGVGVTEFYFDVLKTPESNLYNSNSSSIKYYVNSSSTNGPISKIAIISSDKNLKSLPTISNLDSKASILFVEGLEIGKVGEKNIEILDIGADYSSDFSIRPTAKFASLFGIDSFSTIESISVLFPAKNYYIKPDLILFDTLTEKQIDDVILDYDIQNHRVKILRNTNKISGKYIPKIIPINNSNGVGIDSIGFNSFNNTVTVGLAKSYNSPSEFPFRINDEIIIENISVGIGSTLRGYNSSEYNYASFAIVGVHTNAGGIGASITYSMNNYLNPGEILGTFDSVNSSGKVIKVLDLPKFDIKTKKTQFIKNEKIISNNSVGIVQSHDFDRDIIKVFTTDEFSVEKTIRGMSSNTLAKIKDIKEFDLNYNVNGSSIVRGAWNKETGFLNYNTQRIHDSDYYQYFSYAIKSKVEYDKWNENVSKLAHTSGFKKFGDFVVDSDSKFFGMNKDQDGSDISGIADIYGVVDINCYPDFDLVRENSIQIGSKIGSNEVSFNSRILQDYVESIGNRVLVIDDISKLFNSNPRTDKFSIVDTFPVNLSQRYKKYFFSVKDTIYFDSVEVGLISLLHDSTFGYLNQYGFVSTTNSLGSFDFSISVGEGRLEFYPNNSTEDVYDIHLLSFSIPDIAAGIGSTNIGSILNVSSNYNQVSTSTTTSIVSISSTYRSSKVLVQIGSTDGNYYEINEFTLLNDGSNVNVLEYGLLNTNSLDSYSTSGIATYNFNISGGNMIMEINPIAVVGYGSSIDVNTFVVSVANTSLTGIATQQYSYGVIRSQFTSISSSPTPTTNVVSSFDNTIFGCYYIATVEDLTNNKYQTSEIIVVRNDTNSGITEFGNVYSQDSLGEFSTDISGSNCRLLFTPNPNISVEVRLGEFSLVEESESSPETLELGNGSLIDFSFGNYTGTELDIRKSFDLTYKSNPIFQKSFSGVSTNIVDIVNDTIMVPNHYFVTGEEIEYTYLNSNNSTSNAIGIGTTNISGIGNTTKMPGTLYIVKINDSKVKVAASASEALLTTPNTLNITSVGVGTEHNFTSKKQNTKCLISIDNVIQSPVVSTGVTSNLVKTASRSDNIIQVLSIDNFSGGDVIKINNEIMKIRSVGFGGTNFILIQRPLLGTETETHNTGSQVTKILGNYNIIDNTLYFTDPPFGSFTLGNQNNKPDEQDYFGLEVGSTFNGRVFTRSAVENTTLEAYTRNYLFDSISDNFTGFTTQFTLTAENSNITGIVTSNAIVLVNNILQFPSDVTGISAINAYKLSQNSGITTITFESNPVADYNYDINLLSLPRGGIILSVASTEGFGYQPLVAAGGTTIVSVAGTIQSISIGNSGSGYRSGIQTTVNVGVTTTGISGITNIGTAAISNGNIVSIAVTNPGTGYTSSNPPTVIIDYPLSYYNVPLIYSSLSSGIGTGAKVSIVVGQGTSIISFDILNYGFGYDIGDILTVEVGGSTGIPTNTSLSFKEFQIVVDKIYNDSFFGWTVGDLQILDSIEDLIDGKRMFFPIKIDGQQISIRSRRGSEIDIQSTLLVFVNDVLQVPGEGYIFNGGSIIQFPEPPKENDIIKILFYRGTAEVDTKTVDILETVEIGDLLTINSANSGLNEKERIVEQIINSDLIVTNSYFGIGISSVIKPITLCKQTEDRFVNGTYVSKNRITYEPLIFPTTNIIQNVSTSSTQIFVESVKTFFDSKREYIQNGVDNVPQKTVKILSQNDVSAAISTATVSVAGTITSITISNGGVGYSTNPTVIIQNSVGFGSTATASSTISIGGTVSSITITNPGTGYTSSNPPLVMIEPPNITYENVENVSYDGDFGVIVGVATTSIVGVATTGIVFDLFVPLSSYLRGTSFNVGVATTGISGIQTNYLFVVNNSNIGNGVTALDSSGSVIGVGSTFLDNIYSAVKVSVAQTSVPGIGVTTVTRVVVNVQNLNGLTGTGYSEFFGNYSWGLINNFTRKNPKQFTANINGYAGISTSPSVTRTNSLKYIGYSTT